jgi:hypothetical protein
MTNPKLLSLLDHRNKIFAKYAGLKTFWSSVQRGVLMAMWD